MSEKTRLIAECKRLDPALRVQEMLVPQGSVFQLVLGDGTTMRMQFERHRWSLAQQRDVKLRMLREALIALRFVPRGTSKADVCTRCGGTGRDPEHAGACGLCRPNEEAQPCSA